jgi:uncharacterized protein (DUF362 family)
MVQVAIVKGERSIATVLKAVNLIGGIPELTDKPILIKVNFISTKTWETGVTTDPVVVEALIQAAKQVNPDVYVVESDATMTSADKACKVTGILDLCLKYNVQFINLGREKDKISINVPDPEILSKITLPKLVLDSHIISAAKLKTHEATMVTLGMKNMFGLLPGRFKAKYHLRGISKVIVDINSIVKSSLTVIDGFMAMEGKGPVHGTPKKMDLIIAGKDPVATDAVGAQVMGFEPNAIYHIKRAAEKGIGTLTEIEIVGEDIDNVKTEFKKP